MSIEPFSDAQLMAMGMFKDSKKVHRKVPDTGRIKGTLAEFTSNEDGVDKEKVEAAKRMEKVEKNMEDLTGKLDKLTEILLNNTKDVQNKEK